MTKKIERQLPPLQLRAQFRAEGVDIDKRTAEMVWTTGAKVLRQPFFDEPYYEELSLDPAHVRMDRLNSGAPLLDSHNSYGIQNVIGVVESAELNGAEGVATVRFSEREEVAPIFKDVADKIIRNVSVGYRVYRYQDVSQDDDKIKTYRAIDWEPFELSVVPIGADAGAGFRADNVQSNPCVIETRQHSGDKNRSKAMADKEASAPAVDNGGTDIEQVKREAAQEATRSERKRQKDIREAVRVAKMDDTLADDLIERGVSIDTARAEIINKLAEKDIPVDNAVRAGADASDKFRAGVEQAILIRAGLAKDDRQNELRGYTLRELARECLVVAGANVRGLSAMEMVGRAFTHSSSDFTNILANVANKAMLKGWEEAEETFQLWTASGVLTDFKAASVVDANLFPSLDQVPEGAEYKYGTMGDRGETVQLATYGKLFSITRQAIINDDLGAFTRIPQKMGRAAIRTVGNLVYAILTDNPVMSDGVALFHANHANLAGTGGAPTTTTVDAGRVAMGTQKDPDSNSKGLNIRPRYFIVPLALEGTARVLMESEFDPSKTQRTPNSVRGMAQVISDARLDASSATAWYLAAGAGETDTITVYYLDGNSSPTLEQRDGWTVDGTEFKVRIDAAAKALDYRGLYKNAGA